MKSSIAERKLINFKFKIYFVSAAVLISLYVIVNCTVTAYLVSSGKNEVPVKSDVIIVLGADVKNDTPGKETIKRLDKGMELIKQGYGKKIIVTGGKSKEDNISDGAAMKNYLVGRGVDESLVIPEEKARNTYENLLFSKDIMKKEGYATAVLVSTHYHLPRALSLAELLDYNASAAASPIPELQSITDIKYMKYWYREVPAVLKNFLQHGTLF